MPKYKRKALPVEAYRWTGIYDEATTPKWLKAAMLLGPSELGAVRIVGVNMMKIVSKGAVLTAHRDDFIICGPKGEIYPCNPEVFFLLHDEVE